MKGTKINHSDYSETIPIQYETGFALFLDMKLSVDERVFIPRPETELLVKKSVSLSRENKINDPLILDIGTGSGAVSMGLAKSLDKCRVISVDISGEALSLARLNIEKHGLTGKIELIESDMFHGLGDKYIGNFDLIVSNPPYVSAKDYKNLDAWVKAEPRIALYGGIDGMDCIKLIIEKSKRFLKTGGSVLLEIGYDQAEKTRKLFLANGFSDIESYRDGNNYDRVIKGTIHG